MNKPRRHFLGTEKVAILKRHLIDKVPVSDLCDELDIYPNQLYGWLKEFFENGHAAFDNGRKSKAVEDAQQAKIQQLEAKLTRKNEVMAELMEALTEQKTSLGELYPSAGSPMTRATSSSISSAPGPTKPTSRSRASSPGSASHAASTRTGSRASAKSTNTTPGCHAIIGSPRTKSCASATSLAKIPAKVIAA